MFITILSLKVLISYPANQNVWPYFCTKSIKNSAALAGTHTQLVYGSRYDSVRNTFLECKKIEFLNTIVRSTLLNLHFSSNILTFRDIFGPQYAFQNLQLASLISSFHNAFGPQHTRCKVFSPTYWFRILVTHMPHSAQCKTHNCPHQHRRFVMRLAQNIRSKTINLSKLLSSFRDAFGPQQTLQSLQLTKQISTFCDAFRRNTHTHPKAFRSPQNFVSSWNIWL